MSATLLGVADDTATDPEDLVPAIELEATRRDPYRLSRLVHLVGRRTRA